MGIFAYIREKSKNLKTFLDKLWESIQRWFKKGKADDVEGLKKLAYDDFVKAKKYAKWSDEDNLADLDALNKNFGTNHKLDYFEKFDLETYIKNLK